MAKYARRSLNLWNGLKRCFEASNTHRLNEERSLLLYLVVRDMHCHEATEKSPTFWPPSCLVAKPNTPLARRTTTALAVELLR
jgi:hypothetical protein